MKSVSNQNLLKIFTIGVTVIFFISLVPIIIASFYSHPTYDDFGFSAEVYHTIQNGGNIFNIIASACKQVNSSYFSWQGTFSAIFIFALQPGAFSLNLYFITTFVLLFFLIFSTYYFIDTIICKLFNSNKYYSILLSVCILFVSIQFVIDKTQAFYWWNGATYYSLFYSFSLLLFAVLIRLHISKKKSKQILYNIEAYILAIIIGGGNYTTALTTTVILIITTILLIFYKQKNLIPYVVVCILLLTSLIISAMAPGNNIRAATCEGMNPIKSIIYSIFYSFVYFGNWTQLPQLVLFIFATPILYKVSKSVNYKFKYPIIAIILSFLVFATQLTPSLYAMSSIGSGRQINIYYYSYYLFMLFDIFYICGWLNHRSIIKFEIGNNFNKNTAIITLLCLLIVFIAGSFPHSIKQLTSIDTGLSIINGNVKLYDNQYKKIIKDINNGKTSINDIDANVDFLNNFGITSDSSYWVNKQIQNYFNTNNISKKK